MIPRLICSVPFKGSKVGSSFGFVAWAVSGDKGCDLFVSGRDSDWARTGDWHKTSGRRNPKINFLTELTF